MTANELVDRALRDADAHIRMIENLQRDYPWLEQLQQQFEDVQPLPPMDELNDQLKMLQEFKESVKLTEIERLPVIDFTVPAPSPQREIVHCGTCACDRPSESTADLTGGYL